VPDPVSGSPANPSELWSRAQELIPGGVNSPVRAFGGVGGTPVFIARGAGSHTWDESGKEYIDYVCSWGPLILGHAPAAVVKAIAESAARGTTFGAPTRAEVEMAGLIHEFFPSMDLIRLVSSGTEAAMSAIRVARGFTGRDKILKFDGCYHGHSDGLLVKAGSGVATLSLPDSHGVPSGYAAETLVARYNDLASVEELFKAHRDAIAAIIVEAYAGNMGVVSPADGFLKGLRTICDREGALLVFDEVISGFRLAPGGAQEISGIKPDLTVLGKIIGGGLPIGAFGGRREVMEKLAPVGPVYQAGTLSGNPVAVAAGITVLKALKAPGIYEKLEQSGKKLAEGLAGAAKKAGVPVIINRAGSMMTMFFTAEPVTDYASALKSDKKRYADYFHKMLDRGIYLAPSQFEALFVSTAHTEADIAKTVKAAEESLK